MSFERVSDSLTGPPDTFLICVGIHPKRHRRITMAQAFRYADHIRAVRDGDACGAVPELVRVKVLYAVLCPELLKIPGGALRVHGIGGAVLGEHPLAQVFRRLFPPEL